MLGPTVTSHERLRLVYQAMLVVEAVESEPLPRARLRCPSGGAPHAVAREGGEPVPGGFVDQQMFLRVAGQMIRVGMEEPGSPKPASSAIRWPAARSR